MHEAQMHEANCFITLTYDEEHLPEDGSLVLRDWQLFAKKLRAGVGAFRFFHCGEYGDRKGRPHYHAAIFSKDFRSDRTREEASRTGLPQWSSAALAAAWEHGRHRISALTFESAAYVARYVMGKQTGDGKWRHYGTKIQVDQGHFGAVHAKSVFLLKPEYSTMSRRPGLGQAWIHAFMSDVYPRDEVMINGHATRPPKFYDKEYEKVDPVGYRKLILRRLEKGEEHSIDNTYWRLATRETVARAGANQLSRDL